MHRALQQLHYYVICCQISHHRGSQYVSQGPLARKRVVARVVSSRPDAWDDALVLQYRISGALSTQKFIHKWGTLLTLNNGEEDVESTVVEDLDCDDLDTQLTVDGSPLLLGSIGQLRNTGQLDRD